MTKNNLKERYFDWMYRLVYDSRYFKNRSYKKLLSYLDEIDFRFSLPMDDNRSEDGIDLRYRFGYDEGQDARMVSMFLDDRPCSVLEMMVALSLRCEEQIMDNPEAGGCLSQWFWDMLTSLGLTKMDDEHFSYIFVANTINRFLDHNYEPNGRGGLFTIRSSKKDLRNVEIWYQACWYLDEILEKGA